MDWSPGRERGVLSLGYRKTLQPHSSGPGAGDVSVRRCPHPRGASPVLDLGPQDYLPSIGSASEGAGAFEDTENVIVFSRKVGSCSSGIRFSSSVFTSSFDSLHLLAIAICHFFSLKDYLVAAFPLQSINGLWELNIF